MNRRELFAGVAGTLFGFQKRLTAENPIRIEPRADIVPIYEVFGDFYTEIRLLRSGGAVDYFYATLGTYHPKGKFYRTTVLERLRAAGLVEKNNPLGGFIAVTEMREAQPFIKVITLKTTEKFLAIEGGWWFLVNKILVTGDEVNASQSIIEAREEVSITLAAGTTGKIL